MKSFRYLVLIFVLVFVTSFAVLQADASPPDASPADASPPYGAKVSGAYYVPSGTHTTPSFSTEQWDVGEYFNPLNPDLIPIPYNWILSGRYVIHVAVRWLNHTGPAIIVKNPYYYTYLKVNGVTLGNDARATANKVEGATGTTQYYSLEVNLNAGDTVQLGLWQNFGATIDANVYLTVTFRPR